MDNMQKNRIAMTYKGVERFKTRSERWHSLTQHDIQIFVNDTAKILKLYIKPNDTIGLFLDFDHANITAIILYRACIACGATVVRCSISDLERQIPIICDIELDIIICSPCKFRYLRKFIKYTNCILIDDIENYCMTDKETLIYELYDIPGFILKYGDDQINCPGYNITCSENDHISISSKKQLQVLLVENYKLNILYNKKKSESKNLLVEKFIAVKLADIFLRLFGTEDIEDNMVLNSLSLVELLINLEEAFGISIPFDMISRDNLANTHSIIKLILFAILEGSDEKR